jgi:hypothetical protein
LWPTKQKRRITPFFLTRNSLQIISVTEHHLCNEELEGIALPSYTLGAKFCRLIHKCGGVSKFIRDIIHHININMDRYSNEKDMEICAAKLNISSHTILIITLQVSNW